MRRMYAAVISLQRLNLKALRTGEGRGLSTTEMAAHLEKESGMLDLYEAATMALRVLESRPNEGSVCGVLERALTKARQA